MSRRRAPWTTSALLLAVVAALASCSSGPEEGPSPASSPQDTAQSDAGADGDAAGGGTTSDSGSSGSSPGSTDPSSSSDPSGSSGAGAAPAGGQESAPSTASEIEADAAEPSESSLPGLRPVATGPLVSRPLPAPAAARGRLVAGFPTSVVSPVPGSDIATSGVTSYGTRLQATLTASTTRSAGRTLLHYRVRLGRLGFVESPAPAGATEISFTRGRSTATVSTSPGDTTTGGTTSYAVFTTLQAG